MNKQKTQIREVLRKLYDKYNHLHLIKPDPLQFVYNYTNPNDREIAGFLAAALAYGRVGQIEKSVANLLKLMGKSPYEFVLRFGKSQHELLADFKHRFTTGSDISDLLEVLKRAIEQKGSIEKYFLLGYNKNNTNIRPALAVFCNSLSEVYANNHGGNVSRGLKYLLANPEKGSACKRLNLFLRWMVRNDEVDAGLWKSVDKAKLIIPMDVHMTRLTKILGFHDKKTVSLKVAIEVTEKFREIEPNDPVKYDFALSRIGIIKNCNGQIRSECEACELAKFCLKRKGKKK